MNSEVTINISSDQIDHQALLMKLCQEFDRQALLMKLFQEIAELQVQLHALDHRVIQEDTFTTTVETNADMIQKGYFWTPEEITLDQAVKQNTANHTCDNDIASLYAYQAPALFTKNPCSEVGLECAPTEVTISVPKARTDRMGSFKLRRDDMGNITFVNDISEEIKTILKTELDQIIQGEIEAAKAIAATPFKMFDLDETALKNAVIRMATPEELGAAGIKRRYYTTTSSWFHQPKQETTTEIEKDTNVVCINTSLV